MNKPFVLASISLVAVLILYFGFSNSISKDHIARPDPQPIATFNVEKYIDSLQSSLPAAFKHKIEGFNHKVETENTIQSKSLTFESLGNYWKDSLKAFVPYAFYNSEAAKLDNSEKKLTFAARIFLNNLRWENNEVLLKWETSQAIELFEKALAMNPEDVDLKIGLGSSYIFGRGRSGNPEETMKGVQTLLSVVRQDSTNMQAQFMLGMGGYISGQYDKAIERLKKVVEAQPQNAEAIAFLADTYAAKGDKVQAIKWYNVSKRVVNDPHYSTEVDNRIKQLR